MKTQKTNKKKLDTIIKGVFTYWIVFIAIAWVTYWVKGDLPEVLIEHGLNGGAIELVLAALIEIFSNKGGKRNE